MLGAEANIMFTYAESHGKTKPAKRFRMIWLLRKTGKQPPRKKGRTYVNQSE